MVTTENVENEGSDSPNTNEAIRETSADLGDEDQPPDSDSQVNRYPVGDISSEEFSSVTVEDEISAVDQAIEELHLEDVSFITY